MNEKPLLEICVDSLDSALAAQRGGANRVELCSNLHEGGVTPSAGLIAVARREISIALHVMIRPRGGEFLYTPEEIEAMKRDIDITKQARADGVVLGILDAQGNVDVSRTSELVERARPLSVTFHRAFDLAPDLFAALEDVMRAGAHRVLTSGGESKAEDALPTLAALVEKSAGRIAILVGGGIRDHNVKRIVQATGAREVHVGHSGVAIAVAGAAHQRNAKVRIGTLPERDLQRQVASEEKVRKLVEAF